MKSTLVPVHIVDCEAEIFTDAGKLGFTVIVTELDVAGEPVTQSALEVSSQVTTSLLLNEVLI